MDIKYLVIDVLAQVPDDDHAIMVFPDRAALRSALEQFNRGQEPAIGSKSLIRKERLWDRSRRATLHLRTRHQMTVYGRSHDTDGAAFFYPAPGVHADPTLISCAADRDIPAHPELSLI